VTEPCLRALPLVLKMVVIFFSGWTIKKVTVLTIHKLFTCRKSEVFPSEAGLVQHSTSPATRWPQCHRRHSTLRAAVAALLVLGLVAVGATPAFADEFQVGILIDPSLSEADSGEFMDGFQLAVDQSPDVSHPEGVEGGDHLGSMDVVFVVTEVAGEPNEVLGAALQLIEGSRPPIIIADVSADALAIVAGPVAESEAMLIAMSGTGASELPDSPLFFAAGEGSGAAGLLTDRSPTFEEAFATAYSRQPTAAAARGYLAGRLVDLAVEATDRDPTDSQTLMAAMLEASGSAAPEQQPQQPPADNPDSAAVANSEAQAQPSSAADTGRLVIVAGGVALLVTAGLAVGLIRRHRRRLV